MKDINIKKPAYYFISLFLIIISIDIFTYMLLPILKNNLAFLLIGIFNIILDMILLFCLQHGFNWARWTFIISLIIKSALLISNSLDDLFIINNFNSKYVIFVLYCYIILMLSLSKSIRNYYTFCSKCIYYLDQCREYSKLRYDIPIILNKKFNIASSPNEVIVIHAQSVFDNCSFSITIKNEIIYDDYFEHYFGNQINSKIKSEITKYALKSNELYAKKLLSKTIKSGFRTDGMELNIDSSLNIFGDYKNKVPPYELFYERNSSNNNLLNFTYSININPSELELNVQYIYLVLQTLMSFNFKFDIINFCDYDSSAIFTSSKVYSDSNYIIKELPYSEASNILANQDLSYIEEKVNSYIMNITTNHNLSLTYSDEAVQI